MSKNSSVEVQMDDILSEVSKEVKGVMQSSIKKTAQESAQKLRNTSPKGSPHLRGYAEGWTASKQKKTGDYIVHNKTNYQLTHLLENSHLIKNKKGEYGRTSPGHGQVVHIKPVEEWAVEDLPERIMRELEL